MARFTFETGKRPEDMVKRLDFNGKTYLMHFVRDIGTGAIESVEMPFFYQVDAWRMPNKIQKALHRLDGSSSVHDIAQAVHVLTEFEEAHYGIA